MSERLLQIWDMLIGRLDGPMAFRFIMQPTVAAILGVRAGLIDARAGNPAYGWHLLTHADTASRRQLALCGWSDVAKLYIAAAVIDLIEQAIIYRWIYPGQALLIAALLAFPTYIVIRGLTGRIAPRVFGYEPATADPPGRPDK